MSESMWQPACSVSALAARAELYTQIRNFFAQRKVLEVETPILSSASASDPHLESVIASLRPKSAGLTKQFYLHTSPEFPMKRLLASGSGPIYQICKTFRNGEAGLKHNPEFSMLEWYRPGYQLADLMDEVEALISLVLSTADIQIMSYRDAFLRFLDIDPFVAKLDTLASCARELSAYQGPALDRDGYLNILLSIGVEPYLGADQPVFITEYPASQASLAKIKLSESGYRVAERFELYYHGLELANGYLELTDSLEQRARFEQDNVSRRHLNLPLMPIDENLMKALQNGLPESSGVALGLDRLLMLKMGFESISDVLAFPIDRA